MAIALCGAHRVGKSTLAQIVANEWGYTYVPSRGGEVYKEFGLDVNTDLTFEQRMNVQERILELHIQDLARQPASMIACRSTIDFAAYTLCEWGVKAPADGQKRLMSYIDKCLASAEWLYSAVVLIQPGIPYIPEEGKPRASASYQEIMNCICCNYIKDDRVRTQRFIIGESVTDLGDRFEKMCLIHKQMIANLPSPDIYLQH